MTRNKAIKLLRELKRNSDSNLYRNSIKIIVNNSYGYDNIEDFFNDLFSNGCQSGMISELIYYVDTHKFSKKHIEEILDLKNELEDEFGESIKNRDGDIDLNFLAWLGFEETARKIYHDMGFEDW